jgi:CheY-like chemotaxis protein
MERTALRGVHVLLVNDISDSLELLQVALEYCGALVVAAMSAKEALARLRTVQPDVVVTDLTMPEYDGFWLLRQIRGAGLTMPVIAVTGVYDVSPANDAGFARVMRKPLDPWDLCTVIANTARQRS